MKIAIVVLGLLLLAACADVKPDGADGLGTYCSGGGCATLYRHEDDRATCYVLVGPYKSGVSCVPRETPKP